MRTLGFFCAAMCLLATATNSIAQEDPKRQAVEEKVDEAARNVERATGMLTLAQVEQGLALWELYHFNWQAERKPLVVELSRLELNMQALMRMEHTLEEREALSAKLQEAIEAVDGCDWDHAGYFGHAFSYLDVVRDYETTDYFRQDFAKPEDVELFNSVMLATAPIRSRRHAALFLDGLDRSLRDTCEYSDTDSLRGLVALKRAGEIALKNAYDDYDAKVKERDEAAARLRKAEDDTESDKKIQELQQALEDCDAAIRESDEARDDAESDYDDLRAALDEARMEINAATERLKLIDIALAGELELYSGVESSREEERPVFVGRMKVDTEKPAPRVIAYITSAEDCEVLAALKGVKTLEVRVSTPRGASEEDKQSIRSGLLQAVAAHTDLETLNFEIPDGCTAEDLAALKELKGLKDLSLVGAYVSTEQLKVLADIPVSATVSLSIDGEDEAMAEVCGSLTNWSELSLGVRSLDVGLAKVLAKLTGLDSIVFSVGEDGVDVLRELASSATISRVYLQSDSLRSEHLAALRGMKSLRHLSINQMEYTDEVLEGLRGMDSLESLDLSGCYCLSEGVIDVLSELKGLKSVDLGMCLGIPRWAKAVLKHRRPELEILPFVDFPDIEED